jgi:hypothetical protein
MAFGNARGIAVDSAGNVQTGVTIEVRRMVTGFPLAIPIYADSAGDTALDNPFFSADGEFQFYAVGGSYRVTVTKAGFTKQWDDVQVGSAQSIDVDHYAEAGFTWAPESATTTPPTAGCIRFDNADVSLAQHVYVSKDTLGAADATAWLTSLAIADWLLLSTGVGIEVGWPVVGITNHTSWFDIEVDDGAYAGPVGPLPFGDSGFVVVAQQRAGRTTGTTVVKTSAGGVTIGSTDAVLLLNKAAPSSTAVTLPAVATRNGLSLKFADIGGNAGDITFTPDGTEKIMGLSSMIAVSNGQGAGLAASGEIFPSTDIGGWYTK